MKPDIALYAPTIIAAAVIGLTLQWIADSGDLDYYRLLLKIALAILAYSVVVFGLNARNVAGWKFIVSLAIFGTIINFFLATIVDGYFSYLSDRGLNILNMRELGLSFLGTLILRWIVLTPIFAAIFAAVWLPLRTAGRIILGRLSHPSLL